MKSNQIKERRIAIPHYYIDLDTNEEIIEYVELKTNIHTYGAVQDGFIIKIKDARNQAEAWMKRDESIEKFVTHLKAQRQKILDEDSKKVKVPSPQESKLVLD